MSDLAARAGRVLGPRHTTYVVALVRPGSVEVGAVRADDHADVELGSVSKGVTGFLWRDAIARGELAQDALLGDHLDVPPRLARIPLTALATHSSGLPRVVGPDMARRTWDLWRHGRNPYREDLDDLLALLGSVRVRRSSRPSYSNLGFELLGHAVAAAAGRPYADLVAERLAGPLGLTDTYVPTATEHLRAGAVAPRGRSGRETEPWANESLAPAGGVRSSATDLALLLRAMLDRTVVGADAMDPVAPLAGRMRIGAGWLTGPLLGSTVTWHNGGTGGFRSFVGVDRESGTGVALVSASTRSVDGAAARLLAEAGDS
ncbi:serine hydrolase [Nocardioides sp. zg-1228]|uniref:serine hydrolase domain-containing protein n=1 Tax=Nocardioides sp. zg-1228 TaxID=2763008 RepID=UPI001643499D|nr:serine hydrolase domain-containing protein [Nocardioides sp. zg-1228]MBC2933242.1 beta-lactamase family protein [Nocardioides sp. zg-1228]QSF56590.1 beta-lactamase family protein [Nocardioides sp. zg-1228]